MHTLLVNTKLLLLKLVSILRDIKKKFQLNAKEFNLDATKIVKQLENESL